MYNHLNRDQRSQIYALMSNGSTQKNIAAHLGVHPSTISRELKRNTGGRGYRFQQADNLASARRHAASSTPKSMTPQVIKIIEEKLQQKWSPEQISGRLKLELGLSISYESIYKHIWADKKAGGTLYMHLRHAGKKYNKRSSGKAGRGCIPNRVDITERPAIVETKSRLGDWEGDTIIGKNHQGGLLQPCFDRLANPIVHTITYDNGKEFAGHEQTSASLDAQCYFATPYHSWERGLNEHTNGLVRQYLPKGTEFTTVSAKSIQRIEDALNDRPRKILSYLTPREVYQAVAQA